MKKILLVDDNTEFLELLSATLRPYFQIYEATGVQEAIRMLETVAVDAICSDYYMRDGTGLDLLQMLRLRNVRIPFMLMSASDDRCLISEVRRWGAIFCDKTSHNLIAQIKAMDITKI